MSGTPRTIDDADEADARPARATADQIAARNAEITRRLRDQYGTPDPRDGPVLRDATEGRGIDAIDPVFGADTAGDVTVVAIDAVEGTAPDERRLLDPLEKCILGAMLDEGIMPTSEVGALVVRLAEAVRRFTADQLAATAPAPAICPGDTPDCKNVTPSPETVKLATGGAA